MTDDLVTLQKLVTAVGGPLFPAGVDALWGVIAAEVKRLANVTYQNLPATGLLLDATDFAHLPFVEGESLHYKPAVAHPA